MYANARLLILGSGGINDIAKFGSLAEWKILHIINGEYYCEKIAVLMRKSLDKVSRDAPRLLSGEEKPVKNLTDGLLLAGSAMAYAGVTRPASGMERYVSHIMDTRHLAFGTPSDLHGIQVDAATLRALRLYEKIEKIEVVDITKATGYTESFNYGAWQETLRSFVGKAGESMIALEKKDRKYDVEKHRASIQTVEEKWPALKIC